MPLALQIGEVRNASVAFRAADGSASSAKAGSVLWSTSDPAVLSVTPDLVDETKAVIEALTAGAADLTASGNANLGSGDPRVVASVQDCIVS